MKKEKPFLTENIIIRSYESDNLDRYTLVVNKKDFINYLIQNDDDKKLDEKKLNEMTLSEIQETYEAEWENWNEASLEEVYFVPMMNALRYFPSCVDFNDEEQQKVYGATGLIYDNELEAWAVCMTGGGMDLSPHLLATFINLSNGVPIELAIGIKRNYNAYVAKEEHEENCDLLTKAFDDKAKQFLNYAIQLRSNKITSGDIDASEISATK